MALLAHGIVAAGPPATPDLGPLVAIAAALLVTRFVIWGRLTVVTASLSVVAALLWAAAAHRLGAPVPTLVALGVIWLLTRAVRSATEQVDEPG